MEDQGIMALPQGQAMQGQQAGMPQVNPEAEAAFEEARTQVNPVEFNDELLNQAEKADPETVAEFRNLLASINLSPEMIDALGQMVDTILAEPEKYEEIRSRFIAEGVPPDFLPEQFDAAFFGALNMALDQLSAGAAPEPMAFAYGGDVKKTPVASGIAQLGRNGDTQLAHITMSEARMLRRKGGSGTINPSTGLPEYFLSKVFKSVGKVFKKVGSAVSKAVKGVVNGVKKFAKSTVGRIVTTIALGFFLGPAAASLLGVGAGSVVGTAISGFVGGFGSSLLAGDNVKTAIRNGAIGGITAGAMSGVTGSSFYSPSTQTAGEALSGQFTKFTEGIRSLTGQAPAADKLTTTAQEATLPKPIEAPAPNEFTASSGQPGVDMARANLAGTATDVTAGTTGPIQQTPTDFMRSIEPRAMGQQLPAGQSMVPGAGTPTGVTAPTAQPGFFDQLTRGDYTGAARTGMENVTDFFSPKPDAAVYDRVYSQEMARLEATRPGLSAASREVLANQAAEKAAAPMFGTTSRLVGTGILGLAATGGFKQEPPAPLNIIPKETGEDLLKKYPEKYSVTPGGATTVYGGYGGRRFANGGIAAVAPSRFNMGGFAGYKKGGIMSQNFPRKTGPINGPGTGTSDSIPAMLSDGEFVFTAKAVRGAGKGSRREGAKRMYAMMKALERKA